MSASVDGESSKRDDPVNCVLCNLTFSEPKLLPCLHTFCLGCLTTNCDTSEPRCPTCSKKFSLSDGGFKQLPSNELIKRLVDLQKAVNEQSNGASCSTCTETDTTRGTKRKVMATMYCLDCEQNLCPGCEKIHKRLKTTSSHTKIEIEELRNAPRPLEKLAKLKVQMCPQHPQERFTLFCCNCNCCICNACNAAQHKTHYCEEIGQAAERIRNQLKQNIDELMTWSQICELDRKDRSTENQQYLSEVAEVGNSIKKSADAAKELIDQQANELFKSLKEAKSKKLEANIRYEYWHDSQLASVEHCLQFVLDVLANGSDDDVAGLSGLIDRNLKQISEARPEVSTVDQLSFTPATSGQSNHTRLPTSSCFGSPQPPLQPQKIVTGQRSGFSTTIVKQEPCAPFGRTCLVQNSLGAIHVSSQQGSTLQNVATFSTNPAIQMDAKAAKQNVQCQRLVFGFSR